MLFKISDIFTIHRKGKHMLNYLNNSEPSDMNREKEGKNIRTEHSISEISMPKESAATNIIPDEIPRKDGPSGQ